MVFCYFNFYGFNPMKGRLHGYDGLILLLLLYLLVMQIEAIWPFTIDDMYITLRYAKHLSAGHGLLWNLNEPPVEGYSNFSFLLLGTAALYFNVNPVVVLKGMGIIGLLFSCLFLFLITRFWFEQRVSFIPCIALLLYKGEILWAVSGLETTVYQALITASVYFIFRGLGYRFFPQARGPIQRSFLLSAGVLMALAGMTRPEAPALMALFFILIAWDKPSTNKFQAPIHWQSLALFLLPIFLIYLPYFLWRWHYYGFLFPNPIYCKGFATDSFLVVGHYMQLIWPFLPFILVGLYYFKDKRLYFLCLPSVLYCLMLVHADPIVAFDNRLFLAVFALLLPLVLIGLSQLILLYTRQKNEIFVLCLLLCSSLIAVLFIPKMTLSEYRYFNQSPIAGEHLRKKVLYWLDRYAYQDHTVVLGDAGMIPYYSDLKFIDSYCLNNKQMAHDARSQRYQRFCHRILKDKPEVIILTSLIEQGETTYAPVDACLKKLLAKQNNYKLSQTFISKGEDSFYRYEVFANF